MEFRVLGPLEVVGEQGPISLGGPKQRVVLAHLILRAGTLVPAERLIDEIWGEEPPETARNTLQTYVYRLRKLLGDGRIEAQGGGYLLRATPEEVDSDRFETLVRRAKQEVDTDPMRAAASLKEALALWRGTTLADLSEEPSLRGEVARLDELRLSATERRIAAEIALGGHSTVVSELEALTARYPLRERMWANLMLALYRSGRQAEALSTFERAREVLSEELGTEPSPELQRLHEQILRQDPILEPAEAPAEPPPRAVRPSRLDMEPGTEFAGYRILSTLGRGGMSVVYLAEHAWLQRRVALKVLAPQLAEDESFRERFIRESRLAASLDHPNVIPIFEAGASGADLYIAMRYVEGTDLRTQLREGGALDRSRAITTLRQVASGLDAAHEQGLVHRDVKPGNVLIARARGSEAGEHVYLSDFGLTKRSASDSGVTGTGQFVGTLDYAAPEQFKGGAPDARTDVYSLGCVLFECLTGRPPFVSENDAGLMYAHLQEPPPSVVAQRPELPRAIDAVVAKAMAKSPSDRFPSAGAMVDEAARALGLGGPAEASSARGSALRWLVPAFAVVVALVAGIMVSSVWQGDAARPQDGDPASPSTRPTVSPSPDPAFRTVDRPLTPDEERLLTYVPADVAADCQPLDRDEPVRGELATIVCRSEAVEVLYELFPTRDLMDAAFQLNANGTAAPDGECALEHLAVGTYTVGGQPAGRVLCYTVVFAFSSTPGQSHIEWTDENTSIYGHAVRHDSGDLDLYEWWLSSSGPVSPEGGPRVEKNRPRAAVSFRLDEGSYLATPPGGCAGFGQSVTCVMSIDGGRYRLLFTDTLEEAEEGSLLRRKPGTVVFDPESGYCLDVLAFGEGARDPRPTGYEISADGELVSFQRTSGGRCAGPGKLSDDPWTHAPAGEIAVEFGGQVTLIAPAGEIVGEVTSNVDTETLPNVFPDWSPDGSRLVYAGADLTTNLDLFVVAADGADRVRITEQAGDEYSPAWSPDGSRIAYGFDDEGEPDWRSGIAIVNPDGSGSTELHARDGERVESPVWSPDSGRIAFTVFTDAGPQAYVVGADGGDPVLVRSGAFALSWTPDGERIVLSTDGSLVKVLPDGSDEKVLVADPPEDGRLVLDYSPDGRWIVMTPPSGYGNSVYLMRADGSELHTVGRGSEPSWRPMP